MKILKFIRARATLAVMFGFAWASAVFAADSVPPARDNEPWPEQSAFKPSGGQFHDKLSPEGSYVYDPGDAVFVSSDLKAAPVPGAGKLENYASGIQFLPVGGTLQWFGREGGTMAGSNIAAWKLGAIKPGRYWVGIQIESGDEKKPDGAESNWSRFVRVNGSTMNFSTMTVPVYVGKGKYATEIQSAQALDLKPGDSIAVDGVVFVGCLKLYPQEPKRGPIFRVPGYLTTGKTFLAVGGVSASIIKPGTATVQYWFRNLTDREQSPVADFEVRDYFGRLIKSYKIDNKLEGWAKSEGSFEFPVGDAPRYYIRMSIHDSAGIRTSWAFLRTDVVEGLRQTLSLNGAWQQARIPKLIKIGEPPPADTKWEPYNVPGIIKMGAELNSDPQHRHTHIAWAKRSFEVPERMRKGERIILNFTRLSNEAVIYVNGVKVGDHFDCLTPCEFDITDVVKKDGANEVMVGIRDWICWLDQKILGTNGPVWETAPYYCQVFPNASFLGQDPTAGIIGPVTLDTRPAVAVTEVWTQPSTRKGSLSVDLRLANSAKSDRKITVACVVKDDGKPVLELPRREVTIKAGAEDNVKIDAAFPKPHFWTLNDPHLYELATTVTDAGGVKLDEDRSRFGFREFYMQDGLYMMNGEPAKITNGYKEEDAVFSRSQPSVEELNKADETGYLFKFDNVAGVSGPTYFNLNSKEFWKNAKRRACAIVHAFRNHPSIVAWSPSNEYTCFSRSTGTSTGEDGVDLASKSLFEVGKAMLAEDPVRPIEFDSDWDLNGRWDTVSLHYPLDGAPLERNSDGYIPDCYFFRPLNKLMKPGEPYTLMSNGVKIPAKYLEKPVLMSEIAQYSIFVVHDLTVIGGEEPYRSQYAATDYWQSVLGRYILDGARDIEATQYHPWEHPFGQGSSKMSMPMRYAVALDYMGHWRSGEKVDFQTNIHHDILYPEKMTVRWALLDQSGKQIVGETLADREFKPSELMRTRIQFTVPDVKTETAYTFRMEVLRDGKADFTRDERFVVYPTAVEPLILTRKFGLFDPSGKAAAALKFLGVEVKTIPMVDNNTLAGLDVLLVGPDAVTEAVADKIMMPVQTFVEKGGRVLVFEHDKPVRWLPFRLNADQVRRASFCFRRTPGHPALAGLTDEDIQLWRDDRVVSRHDYMKTSSASVLALIDGGGKLGLEWTPLLEAYFGKGSYILSQILLTEKAMKDPAAAKLLANLLRYEDGPIYRPQNTAAVIAKPGTPLAMRVERLKTEAVALAPEGKGDLNGINGIIADASAGYSDARTAEILDVARNGGKVVLHGLTANTAPIWGKALGAKIELRPVPAYSSGRAIRRDWDGLLDGLSMHELHWHSPVGGDGNSFTAGSRLEELAKTEIVTDAAGARICTYPAVLVSIPLGKGEVLLDQTRWDTADEVVGPLARRIASTLLTNLGVRFKAVPPARKIEGPLAYLPIDLSKFVNRPMVDEVADDNLGGWSDQGPALDGREFPLGRVKTQGITFVIGGEKASDPNKKSIVGLGSYRFKDKFPEVKGIPVGLKVETLCFLHTGAWMNDSVHMFSYVINYADGTKEAIPVIGGVNIRDWWLPTGEATFSDEISGVTTRVGLVTENPTFEAVGAYIMEWVNPYPDKIVVSIDCVMKGAESHTTPVILAMTAGVKAAGTATADDQKSKGDARAKAELLMKQAEEQIAAGKLAEAEATLKSAELADPDFGRAAFLLGQTYRNTKRFTEAAKEYQKAAGLMPDNTEVLNEMGAMFEAQKKKTRALMAYRESLKINWNQPPVLDAVNRLK